MNEKIITIILGLTAGLSLAAVIFLFPKPTPPKSPTSLKSPISPVIFPKSPITLILNSPADNLWATASPIEISGQASPNSSIILISPIEEIITTSSANGQFSAPLKIEDGQNEIVALSGNQAVKRNVILEIKPE